MRWSPVIKTFDPLNTPGQEAAGTDAGPDLALYIDETALEERNIPADDILGHLIEAEVAGDRSTTDQRVSQVTPPLRCRARTP
jgi:hypothetical protein